MTVPVACASEVITASALLCAVCGMAGVLVGSNAYDLVRWYFVTRRRQARIRRRRQARTKVGAV